MPKFRNCDVKNVYDKWMMVVNVRLKLKFDFD